MDRMSEIINEYKSNQWDETKLVTLIDLRRELACLIYELSKKVREAAINYNHAYANRRVETARFKIEHLTNKDTLGMSEAKATVDARDYRTSEAQHEGNYRGGKSVQDSANGVLKSMEQDISFYKKLYDKTE